jgi:hypothetical protein
MPNRETKSTALDLKEMRKLFGAAVLSSESHKDFDAILKHLMDCIEPHDFIEQMFVWDFAEQTWEIYRLRHHKILVMECEHQRHQEKETKRRQEEKKKKAAAAECDARRAKAAEQVPAEQAGKTGQTERAGQAGAPTTQVERKFELEEVINSTIDEVDDILDGPADEVDHARALKSDIEYYKKLDDLLGVAIARRDDALAQIDFYRQGLGQRLRRVSDEIIDAEFKETAPSIAGPDGDAQ